MTSVGDRLGRYEIIGHLARTDLAELLLARVEGSDRHVAIKQPYAESTPDRAAFLSEARLAASLHDPHIVEVLDAGGDEGVPYIAMEYIHGEDLRRILASAHDRSEQVPLAHAVAFGIAAATALEAAHARDVLHRDVSPANILVGYDGTVKVGDFGIARALRVTAPYLSPEQCKGKKLDVRSDVFSLGIVLYELVTCRRLFKASNDYLTMAAIVACEIPPPGARRADLPKSLEAVIVRALSRERTARYQTAKELREALEAAATEHGLRSSTDAIASYVKQLCGERSAPSARAPVHVDFDGKGTGVAAPPAEALKAKTIGAPFKTRSSPIEAARAQLAAMAVTPVAPTPVLIPEGTPRKDPTAPVLPGRTKSATRAPVPPPTRQRPKTIQIPSGTPRGDVTLHGVGIVRPPAAVGDVTIAGTGVVTPPAGSGFEAGGNTTEVVAALAIETTVDVPMPVASTVAAASAVTAARKRSRSSGPLEVPAPLTHTNGPVMAGATLSGPAERSSPIGVPATASSARAAPRLSVMAFASRQHEDSALVPLVVPPSTMRLSALTPITPAPTLEDNWDSSAFPAPPSATAFVPMGAGDAVRIGPPPAIDDDELDSSAVLTPSFIGAVEVDDNRSRTEIVAPLPAPRPSAPPGDAWSNGEDDLASWQPPRRWWPYAAVAGAAALLVLALAFSGGKDEASAPVATPEPAPSAVKPVAPPPAPEPPPTTATASPPVDASAPEVVATTTPSSDPLPPEPVPDVVPPPPTPKRIVTAKVAIPTKPRPAKIVTKPSTAKIATKQPTAKTATKQSATKQPVKIATKQPVAKQPAAKVAPKKPAAKVASKPAVKVATKPPAAKKPAAKVVAKPVAAAKKAPTKPVAKPKK